MTRRRAAATLAMAFAVSWVAVVLLIPATGHHAIPLDDLRHWADTTTRTHMVATIAVWGALLAAGWLGLTTALAVAVAACSLPVRTQALLARTSPVVIRRLAAAAAAPVVASSLPAPLVALEAPLPPPVEVPTFTDGEEAPVHETPAPPSDLAPAPLQPADAAPPATLTTSVTVEPGDNLWVLTARHLADARGVDCADLSDVEIAEVWRDVVRENLPHLRSGDADLIFPGESVVLARA